jgi:hypothetical protein
VLSFLEPGGAVPGDTVFVIRNPKLEDGALTYSIDVLEGTLPAHAGPVTRSSSIRSAGRVTDLDVRCAGARRMRRRT